MKNHGIENVSALYGGLDAWRNLGYPMANGANPK
jgi:3-mercaptopyruvate sulfurtransferase SseA